MNSKLKVIKLPKRLRIQIPQAISLTKDSQSWWPWSLPINVYKWEGYGGRSSNSWRFYIIFQKKSLFFIFSAHSVSPFDWKYTLTYCLIYGVHYKPYIYHLELIEVNNKFPKV